MSATNNTRLSRLAADFIRLKSELSAIISEGHEAGLSPDAIVDTILNRVVIDENIIIEGNKSTSRPVYIKDILLIARTAVEQAEFDGVSAILPSGEKVKKRVNYRLDS